MRGGEQRSGRRWKRRRERTQTRLVARDPPLARARPSAFRAPSSRKGPRQEQKSHKDSTINDKSSLEAAESKQVLNNSRRRFTEGRSWRRSISKLLQIVFWNDCSLGCAARHLPATIHAVPVRKEQANELVGVSKFIPGYLDKRGQHLQQHFAKSGRVKPACRALSSKRESENV